MHRVYPQNGICIQNTIFGLKMMVESGLEKIVLKFLHMEDYFLLLHKSAQNHKFSNENNYLPAWMDFKLNFSRPLFTIIFRPKMVFLDTDSILMVNTMYDSVKLKVTLCQKNLEDFASPISSNIHSKKLS